MEDPELERKLDEAQKAARHASFSPQTEKLPRGCLIAMGLGFALVFIGLALVYMLFGTGPEG